MRFQRVGASCGGVDAQCRRAHGEISQAHLLHRHMLGCYGFVLTMHEATVRASPGATGQVLLARPAARVCVSSYPVVHSLLAFATGEDIWSLLGCVTQEKQLLSFPQHLGACTHGIGCFGTTLKTRLLSSVCISLPSWRPLCLGVELFLDLIIPSLAMNKSTG